MIRRHWRKIALVGVGGATCSVSLAYYYRFPARSDSGLPELSWEEHTRPLRGIVQRTALFPVALACNIFNSLFCDIEIEGIQHLNKALAARKSGVGVLTVSNHVSVIDDPLLFAAMTSKTSDLPAETTSHLPGQSSSFCRICDPDHFRWAMCAREICHKSDLHSAFFTAGRVLPVDRLGAGINQPVMKVFQTLLEGGAWVHMFPEGRVYQKHVFDIEQGWPLPSGRRAPPGRELAPLKWGVGKLIATTQMRKVQDSSHSNSNSNANASSSLSSGPTVIPIFHVGMENVYPQGKDNFAAHVLPRGFQKVKIVIGPPISFDDLMKEYTDGKVNNPKTMYPLPTCLKCGTASTVASCSQCRETLLHARITDRIETTLADMAVRARSQPSKTL